MFNGFINIFDIRALCMVGYALEEIYEYLAQNQSKENNTG